MIKKFFVLLLSLILLLSGIPPVSTAGAPTGPDGPGGYSSDFVSASIKIIQDNWQSTYFSSITMTIGEDNLTIDNKEIDVAPAVIEDGELILPIDDIAQIIGFNSSTDESSN